MMLAFNAKRLTLCMALVLLALVVENNGLGFSQGGSAVTVCASGCDFTKIQQAIDAATSGNTIVVQPGTYRENLTIRNKDGLTLQGAGQAQVTLDGNAPAQQNITPGILILNSRNITVTGFKITNSRRGLEADDSILLFIEANNFEKNLRQGIWLVRSQADLVGNSIKETLPDVDGAYGEGIGVYGSTQAKLANNTIKDTAHCGVRTAIDPTVPLPQVTGSGNTIAGNRGGDLCGNVPLSLLSQPPLDGTLDRVAVPEDVPTIQEAIDKVKAGGTITVAAGTFQQPADAGILQIYKSVTIQGAGAGQTVLRAPGPQWTALIIATDQLQVTLMGLSVTGGRTAVQIDTGPNAVITLKDVAVSGNNGGVDVRGIARVTLDHNQISSIAGTGVWTLGFSQVAILNSTISNSGFRGVDAIDASSVTITQTAIVDNQEVGVVGRDGAKIVLDENTFVRAKQSTGIWALGSAQITIHRSTISESGYRGVDAIDNTVVTIEDSTVSNSKNTGVVGRGSATVTLKNSQIMGNETGIQFFENAIGTLTDSTVSGNLDGIFVGDSARAQISNNQITHNKVDPRGFGKGIFLGGNAQVTIAQNTIANNESFGIELGATNWANEAIQAEISDNKIQSNRDCGLWVDSDAKTKVTGRGNTISGNVRGSFCGATGKFPKGFGGGK